MTSPAFTTLDDVPNAPLLRLYSPLEILIEVVAFMPLTVIALDVTVEDSGASTTSEKLNVSGVVSVGSTSVVLLNVPLMPPIVIVVVVVVA